MSRFGTVAQQYFDASGKPLAGGKLYFYEPGTTTAKTVYSDEDLITSIAQPVTLDASGYQPDIFFAGQAKVKLDDSEDTQVDVVDPVGDQPVEQFPIWESAASYAAGALIQGSDDNLYASIGGSNVGNDPTSTSGFWVLYNAILEYDASYTYNSGSIVYYSFALFRCNSDSTTGVAPSAGASEWDLIALPMTGGTLTGGLTITGALAGVTALSMGGALTGVTTLSMGGALTGATDLTASGEVSTVDLSVSGNLAEADFTISDGDSVTIDPANGMRQTWTLGGNRTPTISLDSGESVLLRVADGASAFNLTLSGVTWTGGTSPTLPTSGYALIYLIKIGSDLYGSYIGDVA